MNNKRTITLSRNARLLLTGLLFHVRAGDHPNRELADEICTALQSDDLSDEIVSRLSSSLIKFDSTFGYLMINVDDVNLELSLEG